MKVGIIGAGRLGICFALLCEKAGYNVLVSDIREDYVNNLNQRKITTNEPLVQELLLQAKNFRATTNNKEVIGECDIIYTLVATPSLRDGSYDVSSVWQVVNDFQECNYTVHGKSFIVGCTTNPGDCNNFQSQLNAFGVDVFYNPEFIAQGSIIKDLENADMVLIGGEGKHLGELKNLYSKIQIKTPSIHTMSTTAAELVKLAVNCFLTTKISYANMVGQVMSLAGLESEIDVVLDAIGSDTRVGKKYLNFGYGFGGPCLPRDNRSFGAYASSLGLKYNLGETTDNFNNEHAEFLRNYFIKKNPDKKIPFFMDHISYKKGSDIMVESQQFRLCRDLLVSGYKVYVYDIPPVINLISNDLYDEFYDRVIFLDSPNPPENAYRINL